MAIDVQNATALELYQIYMKRGWRWDEMRSRSRLDGIEIGSISDFDAKEREHGPEGPMVQKARPRNTP
jgi:hypothetical protein